MTADSLDVITIGRASVDLYGIELGTPLEEARTFRKSVGGCPANIAIGAARLGMKSALVTRVGDEQMGRFILAELAREGVVTSAIRTDKERLTALVLLAVRDKTTFPHIFYRENCADMALCEDDIDPAFIARAKSIVVTGTHFSSDRVAAASWKAVRLAKQEGVKVVFDIDFRPALWGLAAHSEGDARLALSRRVQEALCAVITASDVVVGTEEEFCAATNTAALPAALTTVRSLTKAVIVCKKGARGCAIYADHRDGALAEPIRGEGFLTTVVNPVGAGDAFLSGLLYGWLRGESWQTAASWANACGAIAVSRLLCSSEYPTLPELLEFLGSYPEGSPALALEKIEPIHWATTRRDSPPELLVFAIDHRWQFEAIADELSADRVRLSTFKQIAVSAAGLVAQRYPNVGIICDGQYGAEALSDAEKLSLWVARTIEEARSKPLRFVVGPDTGSGLMTWPGSQVIKCLCLYDPEDPEELRGRQEVELIRLNQACKALGREWLLEIILNQDHRGDGAAIARVINRLYEIGVRPDWWKLEPIKSVVGWDEIAAAIAHGDPYCRGIVILGLTSTPSELAQAFEAAAGCELVRGFAVGRAIVGDALREWLAGRLSDGEAKTAMATRLESTIGAWRSARGQSARSSSVGRSIRSASASRKCS
jgi:5-dehydro-2-deoxygluconokinase